MASTTGFVLQLRNIVASIFTFVLITVTMCTHAEDGSGFSVGIIADCQYADQPDKGQRRYRSSPLKLRKAVAHLNELDLRYSAHLGDFIDEDWASYDPLLAITDTLTKPLYHVLGNHEFSIADDKKPQVTQKLGMPSRYYTFKVENWRFIVVDGNDVSLYGWPKNSAEHKRNEAIYNKLYSDQVDWNGAIGQSQLSWLDDLLSQADESGELVAIYSHFPVYPEHTHNLWNAKEVLAMLERHQSVKAWFSGHNHDGNYAKLNGVHYVTLKAMLDTEKTSYSTVRFSDENIAIQGFGRQDNFLLKVH